MKLQQQTPLTIAEHSTILDPILWACSSKSCLIVFLFCEVAWCVVLCAHVSLCLCAAVGIPVQNCTEWGFFSPLKEKWLILGMCDKSHLYPLFSSEPSFDWPRWGWTLSHITKYDTLKNIDTNTCTHTYTLVWKGTSLFLQWGSSCSRCGIYSACLFSSSKSASSEP